MITGEVTADREAVIRLVVLAADGSQHSMEAIVDTGFTASLTLPWELVSELGLTFVTYERVLLADGHSHRIRVYETDVAWGDEQRTIPVHAVERGVLAGMALLYGHSLRMEVIDGGLVLIEPL